MLAKLQFWQRRAVPLLLQTEGAECGLACLGMVAAYHGYDCDLATLRQNYSISLKGTTLAHLVDIAGELRLSSRAVRVELHQLGRLATPAILHWNFNHFVVLVKVQGTTAVIHDPARGKCTLSVAQVSQHFTGVALELAPTEDFAPKKARRSLPLQQLLGKPPGFGTALLQILLLAGALEIFGVLSPFYMQLVVDQAIVSQDLDLLTVLAIGFLLAALIHALISALRSWVVMVLGTALNLQLSNKLFQHLLRLPMDFFSKRHLGDVVSRFESLNVIQRTLTTSFIEAVVDGFMAAVTILMMAIYSYQLTLIVSLFAVGYALLRLALYWPLRQASEEQILRLAKQQSNFLETVRGVQSVKLFNRQIQRRSLYQNLLIDSFNAGIRIQKLNIFFKAANSTLFGIENIIVIWLGARLAVDGALSVGMLFAFVSYKQQFTSRIISFIEKGIEFRMLGLHAERVGDVALSQPEVEDALGQATPEEAITPRLEVRDLSFRYSPSEPYTLESLNLHIEPGESVAIVGASGCGKTTLLKLMLGLLQPSAGEILIDGIPLMRFGHQAYRKLVGTVMQEDQLFAGSIAENISFFDAHPDQKQIEVCAELASIDQDIARMPMAYNTLIGDMGTVLSGGQKQRVLLARALYKRPKILFLDEATSHLDVFRERHVNDTIRQLKLTRVIVAHRPETIASVDRVIVLGQQDKLVQAQKRAVCAGASIALTPT